MATKKPGQGEVWAGEATTVKPSDQAGDRGVEVTVSPAQAITAGAGTRVRLSRFDQTAKHVLRHPYVFQCPPLESLAISHEYVWSDYDTISDGTFSRPSGKGLRQISFQTLFVDWDATWSLFTQVSHPRVNWKPHPIKLAKELREILNSGTPFELLIGQPRLWGAHNHDARMKATLRTLNIEERAGEIDARYIDVAFTEWRELTVKRGKKGDRTGGGGHRDGLPTTHTIEAGDTLRSLAKRYYGEVSLWRVIAKANGLTQTRPDQDLSEIERNGRRIKTLAIPALSWANLTQGSES